ncbi:transcriptional regulator, IclR family [Actinopolyspora alba]|uniref:Transcriptional regulator, IclR family n=1 Tax=Actinopolyspora alba TaxID=673379 RepID=A0A1I1UG64_9ACTN|nr:helix-turn-helix domain-containing protein [Actinopolyspora alba]SFD69694.1 transcriptional regulator, IclR family [Actinopolyspora alba]
MSRPVRPKHHDETEPGAEANGSLARALLLLRELALRPEGVGVSELSRTLGIPKPSVHRTLRTMRRLGFARESEHVYFPGTELRRLARDLTAGTESRLLCERLSPVMVELYCAARLPVELAVPRGSDVVVLHRVHGRGAWNPIGTAGGTVEHHGATTKVLSAFSLDSVPHEVIGDRGERVRGPSSSQFAEIRRTGLLVERSCHGRVELAAAVLDRLRRPMAVLAMTGPTARVHNIPHTATLLRQAAHDAAKLLPTGSTSRC